MVMTLEEANYLYGLALVMFWGGCLVIVIALVWMFRDKQKGGDYYED